MKKVLPFFAIFLLLLSACHDDDGPCIRGSGSLNTYDDINVADFIGVSVSGPINVNITQGAEQDVVIRAEPEMYDRLVYEVSGNILELGFRRGECVDSDLGVQLDITVPDLKTLEVSGSSVIQTTNNVEFDQLVVSISGEAEMNMTGAITDFAIHCSGSLDATNYGLDTDVQNVEISGQAYIELYCLLELDLIISGSAEVRYKGNPQISQNVSGSLDLINAN